MEFIILLLMYIVGVLFLAYVIDYIWKEVCKDLDIYVDARVARKK